MKEFVVGTEFKKLFKDGARWRKLIQEIRRDSFSGPLIVTANWDEMDLDFWDEADAIGFSAYFPLSAAKNPSPEALSLAWAKHRERLVALSKKWKRPLHITEVGYRSVTYAAERPWELPKAGVEDVSDVPLQTACFEAFSQAWGTERNLVRANFWSTGELDLAGFSISYEFLNKPAESVLDRFFDLRAKLNP